MRKPHNPSDDFANRLKAGTARKHVEAERERIAARDKREADRAASTKAAMRERRIYRGEEEAPKSLADRMRDGDPLPDEDSDSATARRIRGEEELSPEEIKARAHREGGAVVAKRERDHAKKLAAQKKERAERDPDAFARTLRGSGGTSGESFADKLRRGK